MNATFHLLPWAQSFTPPTSPRARTPTSVEDRGSLELSFELQNVSWHLEGLRVEDAFGFVRACESDLGAGVFAEDRLNERPELRP